MRDAIARAAALVAEASGLLITAGAGMGIDSGLPDFRGNEGMWRAYPALGRARLDFTEIANPAAFARTPRLAWGFYGHRLKLYRETVPHPGFAILAALAAAKPDGAFVVTSNVDGAFQKAGFAEERVCEIHGSIHFLQCTGPCGDDIRPADDLAPEIDAERCEMISPLPACPACGALARPNILMFGDFAWLPERTEAQHSRLRRWLDAASGPVILEFGAGTAIPTIRSLGDRSGPPLIRVNPREPEVRKAGDIGVAMGALEFCERLREELAGTDGARLTPPSGSARPD